ncbi:MAG: DNA gyrase inhibitor YacG [Gammaproteobacteria bacterium]|nr:MAG: DNA gyrase inhibitor YacG [Gammaproteobacteria bacterium]
MKVSCPTCKKLVPWSKESKSKPFCSERCRLIDLGQWASEENRIPCAPKEVPLGNEDVPTHEPDEDIH